MNLDIIKNFCDRMADERTPGCSVRVYLKGRPIYSYDCGVSSLETGKKMRGDEFFWIYSCSKVATVTGALKLVEDGIILINDPVYEYIPEWRDVKVKRPDGTLSTPASPADNRRPLLNDRGDGLQFRLGGDKAGKSRDRREMPHRGDDAGVRVRAAVVRPGDEVAVFALP